MSTFYAKHVAYALIMTTRPQTLYGLADSPIDLAAFMLDHGDGTGQPGLVEQVVQGKPPGDLTLDDLLDNITLYWLTNTGVSSARLYWENKAGFFDAKNDLHPVCHKRLSQRAVSGASELGGTGLSRQPDLFQRTRPGRPLRSLGTAEAVRGRDASGVQVAALTGPAKPKLRRKRCLR